jgi:hypothetical protein
MTNPQTDEIERVARRPDIDEALEALSERVEYALRLAAEAYSTPDGEDENGKLDPIFAYTEHVVSEVVPLAVLGLFALSARAALTNTTDGGK